MCMLNRNLVMVALLIGLFSGCPAPADKPVVITGDVPIGAGVTPPLLIENEWVEASCGECQFEMPGDGCHLAIRLDGHTFWVDGTGIDDHGDAHADSGFCNRIRQARVTGLLSDGRFAAEKFELVTESAGGGDLQVD